MIVTTSGFTCNAEPMLWEEGSPVDGVTTILDTMATSTLELPVIPSQTILSNIVRTRILPQNMNLSCCCCFCLEGGGGSLWLGSTALLSMYVCMYVCIHVHAYIHTYTYMYIHTCVHCVYLVHVHNNACIVSALDHSHACSLD